MNGKERKCETRSSGLGGQATRRDFLKTMTVAAGGLALLSVPLARGAEASQLDVLSNQSASGTGFWNHIRSRFVLDPRITHMNTGTEGAMPREVIAKLNDYLIEFASNPMQAAALSADYSYFQQRNRERVAAFTGARADEIVLTTNTTEGMNVVIHGLNLNPGDEVITTLHDHSAGVSPLQVLRDRSGIVVKQIALPSPAASRGEIVDLFRRAITSNTKVISFCHINFTTGLRMPVRELCDMARTYGLISIVDGAHALGMVELNFRDLGCDFYSCAGHKWLNAPPGTGVLFIRDAARNPYRLWPMMTEIYGFPGPVSTLLQVRGQQNTPAIKAMGNAMDFQEAIGKARIEARVVALSRYLKTRVLEEWGPINLLTPLDEELSTGITAFVPSANRDDRYVGSRLSAIVTALREQYRIYIRSVNFFDLAGDTRRTYALRVSTHIFNDERDIDALVAALREVTTPQSSAARTAVMSLDAAAVEEPLFVN